MQSLLAAVSRAAAALAQHCALSFSRAAAALASLLAAGCASPAMSLRRSARESIMRAESLTRALARATSGRCSTRGHRTAPCRRSARRATAARAPKRPPRRARRAAAPVAWPLPPHTSVVVNKIQSTRRNSGWLIVQKVLDADAERVIKRRRRGLSGRGALARRRSTARPAALVLQRLLRRTLGGRRGRG
ncbi:hypothetical protein FA09DRAFT_15126 [Tilletiopsis washingtonensis]|jgi:hypothetical protein|uniref:Uncharacterized protein n=1 Tax=Tilletiopsis washingtonensis TaxID=58919 RepID=A0A316ZJW2_9BASI|nr:hypothetical protein FA09DRAFT_15126 [Tilletiopsis washingtonensis]PWO01429.1 hypothetical protein FA09DRAFT_15126 [Tilletiopsis washingtonensis]